MVLRLLRLVESVVFDGAVYGTGDWAYREQAQFQEIFEGAHVGCDCVVLGQADLIGHGGGSLPAVGLLVSFHTSGCSYWLAGKVAAPAAAL